jgi:hypothetical protein
MSSGAEQPESCHEAPPYSVVQACQGLGFQTPLDVRWYRLSRFPGVRDGLRGLLPWKLFFGKNQPRPTCSCGQPLPVLEKYAFTFRTHKVKNYLLGQCPRCRTVFWEEA